MSASFRTNSRKASRWRWTQNGSDKVRATRRPAAWAAGGAGRKAARGGGGGGGGAGDADRTGQSQGHAPARGVGGARGGAEGGLCRRRIEEVAFEVEDAGA